MYEQLQAHYVVSFFMFCVTHAHHPTQSQLTRPDIYKASLVSPIFPNFVTSLDLLVYQYVVIMIFRSSSFKSSLILLCVGVN